MAIDSFKVFSLVIFDSATSSLKYEILWKISQFVNNEQWHNACQSLQYL